MKPTWKMVAERQGEIEQLRKENERLHSTLRMVDDQGVESLWLENAKLQELVQKREISIMRMEEEVARLLAVVNAVRVEKKLREEYEYESQDRIEARYHYHTAQEVTEDALEEWDKYLEKESEQCT